jgi:hypothetical protein
MKSILFALTVMIGLTGCAEMQQMAERIDRATETPMQRAQKAEAAALAQNDWRNAQPTVGLGSQIQQVGTTSSQIKSENAELNFLAQKSEQAELEWRAAQARPLFAESDEKIAAKEADRVARQKMTPKYRKEFEACERKGFKCFYTKEEADQDHRKADQDHRKEVARLDALDAKYKVLEDASDEMYADSMREARIREAKDAKADKKWEAEQKAKFDKLPKAEQARLLALEKQMMAQFNANQRAESERKRLQWEANTNWKNQVNKQHAYQKALIPR